MKILLVEPPYKNKYPPLGLMKIASFHKSRNDEVVFYKGLKEELRSKLWDRIYIASLFTFHWEITRETILFYSNSVTSKKNIFIGGVMATLMKDIIEAEFKINVISGLLNEKGKLGIPKDESIDCLVPDYDIINPAKNELLEYSYPLDNSYITYATRGCINHCDFCAVPVIEPVFSNSLSVEKQVKKIIKNFGEKRNLLLLDNNVLASECFPKIIDQIKNLGFEKGSLYRYKKHGRDIVAFRYVDFNQGMDARLLTEEKMKMLSEISIKPLRIAFDHISLEKIYVKKVRLAAEYGIKYLSNYILFNYKDTPEDFYRRLEINIELNEEFQKKGLNTRIHSFPMKYVPVSGPHSITRRNVGPNWNKRYLRSIQCILGVTHGVVSPRKDFFHAAFGKDVNEFKEILFLPDEYILYRRKNESNGNVRKLHLEINKLSDPDRQCFFNILFNHDKFTQITTDNHRLAGLFNLYKELRKYFPKHVQFSLF